MPNRTRSGICRVLRKLKFPILLYTSAASLCIIAPTAVATPEIYGGPPAVDTMSTGLPLGRKVGSLAISPLVLRIIALTIVPLHQFDSFDKVITHESSWNVFATNPDSGAYGLGQALPPEKMATHGADWLFNPVTQIRWTYDYMNRRYGGPDGAWKFWQAHHWY